MKLPGTTTYDDWDQLRRNRFKVIENMEDVTVQHSRYETCLFMYDSGNSGIATWECSTGSCYIKTRRQAIFTVLSGMRNYMLNALGGWEFTDSGKNIDSDLPWGVLFSNEEK
jgi:hypothetical protein